MDNETNVQQRKALQDATKRKNGKPLLSQSCAAFLDEQEEHLEVTLWRDFEKALCKIIERKPLSRYDRDLIMAYCFRGEARNFPLRPRRHFLDAYRDIVRTSARRRESIDSGNQTDRKAVDPHLQQTRTSCGTYCKQPYQNPESDDTACQSAAVRVQDYPQSTQVPSQEKHVQGRLLDHYCASLLSSVCQFLAQARQCGVRVLRSFFAPKR